MIGVTSVTANPAALTKSGDTSQITVGLSNPDTVAHVVVTAEGGSGEADISIHRTPLLTTDVTKKGQDPYVVAEVDAGGTIAWNADGTLTFTAS